MSWPSSNAGDSYATLVEIALVSTERAVRVEEVRHLGQLLRRLRSWSVVGSEKYDRLFVQFKIFQGLHHSTDALIHDLVHGRIGFAGVRPVLSGIGTLCRSHQRTMRAIVSEIQEERTLRISLKKAAGFIRIHAGLVVAVGASLVFHNIHQLLAVVALCGEVTACAFGLDQP